MNNTHPLTGALCIALTLALANPALAQSTAPTPAQRKQLDAARAELDRASAHLAELSRKYGAGVTGPVWVHEQDTKTPVIGVLLAPDTTAGVRIAGVTPGGAAADAGLKSGDRLLAVGGHALLGSDADLRLENAKRLLSGLDEKSTVKLDYLRDGRKRTLSLTPRLGENMVFLSRGMHDMQFGGDLKVMHLPDGAYSIGGDRLERLPPIASGQRHPIVRITTDKDCRGPDCTQFPVLAEALRWNGLNLASVDSRLGHYFGTDKGVLVLSAGKDLPGLQPGDVIHRIDGKAVGTPREAMDSLRGRETGSRVAVEYLRDRKTATTQIKVPESRPFPPPPPPPPVPPVPPAPPAPPKPPGIGGKAMAAPHAVERRKVVWVDDKGKQHVIVDDGHGPLPDGAPRVTSASGQNTIERRKIILVDDDGKVQTWEDDGSGIAAPPPPPAPPAPPAPPPPPPAK